MTGRVPRWRTVIVTVSVAYGVPILAALGVIYSGAYDIAAATSHWRLTFCVFETARIRSIKTHAGGITPPAGMSNHSPILIGVRHFAAHQAISHGPPGVTK